MNVITVLCFELPCLSTKPPGTSRLATIVTLLETRRLSVYDKHIRSNETNDTCSTGEQHCQIVASQLTFVRNSVSSIDQWNRTRAMGGEQ